MFAQIFRIVRAVPETLNSGAFLFKKLYFVTWNFGYFQKKYCISSIVIKNYPLFREGFFSAEGFELKMRWNVQKWAQNVEKARRRREIFGVLTIMENPPLFREGR